jgi:hypothetical protein
VTDVCHFSVKCHSRGCRLINQVGKWERDQLGSKLFGHRMVFKAARSPDVNIISTHITVDIGLQPLQSLRICSSSLQKPT